MIWTCLDADLFSLLDQSKEVEKRSFLRWGESPDPIWLTDTRPTPIEKTDQREKPECNHHKRGWFWNRCAWQRAILALRQIRNITFFWVILPVIDACIDLVVIGRAPPVIGRTDILILIVVELPLVSTARRIILTVCDDDVALDDVLSRSRFEIDAVAVVEDIVAGDIVIVSVAEMYAVFVCNKRIVFYIVLFRINYPQSIFIL